MMASRNYTYTWKHWWKYTALCMILIIVCNQLLLLHDHYDPITHGLEIRYNNDVAPRRTKLSGHNKRDRNSLTLTTHMINAETGENVTCDPNKYKYIQLLLHDLAHINPRDSGQATTSEKIDRFFVHKDTYRWYWLRRARMQIIDGYLYTNNNELGAKDEEGYRTGVLLYLQRLFTLYRDYIPDTDFLWHYHDKKGSMKRLNEYDWMNMSQAPIFVSDFNEASLPTRTLYMVPRGYLKYKYFADIAEKHGGEGVSRLYCEKNIRRIKDYLEFLALKKNKPEALEWDNKKINKAVFRGYFHNGFSRRHFFRALNISDISKISHHYFDANFTTEWANTAEQHTLEEDQYDNNERRNFHSKKAIEFAALQNRSLNVEQQFEYRYQVSIDGYGVRDNLMYQMLSGSIILKQLSTLIEFWYYDLIDNKHVLLWENILDLINVVIKVVDSVDVHHRFAAGKLTGYNGWIKRNWMHLIENNMTKYNYDKLKKITENAKEFVADYLGENNMDCFFVHMIEIYNYYFFDVKSLPKTPHGRLKKVI
eukprot:340009_1